MKELPGDDSAVPDKALEELLAAFANDPPPSADTIDLDDPEIDALLGLAGPPQDDTTADTTDDTTDDTPQDAIDTSVVESIQPDAPVDEQPVDEPPIEPDEPVDEQPVEEGPVEPPKRTTIRIGGDDDLPDAVYLDEEAGDRLRGGERSTEASTVGERTTILIADDGLEGAAGGIPVATAPASSIDPRLRARRIAVKRAVGRKRLKWVIVGAIVVILLTAVLAILGSSLFAVYPRNISISGAQRMSQDDLQAAVDRIADHPVLLIDTHSIEAELERSPWVREARVTTHFPHSATIEILEREPLATYQGPDGQFRIIDVEGQVVDVIPGQPIEFMLIEGPGINASVGTNAGVQFTRAAELVEALSPGVRSRTTAVTVSETGALGLRFENGARVVLGSPTDLLDKLTRLEAFLKRTAGNECTTTIDVSTSETACSIT